MLPEGRRSAARANVEDALPTALGRKMRAPNSTNRLAIFAYGSLLFRPGFAFIHRERAVAHGVVRSFSQASPDHRGTPERPGRVLTLVRVEGKSTIGAVYYVDAPAEKLLQELDYRERAGYQRMSLDVATDHTNVRAVTWIAPPGNLHDVGPLALEELASHMRESAGPSGRNDDYVFQLEAALRELGAEDPQISALSALLRR
jgi:cation transport protein ChaC